MGAFILAHNDSDSDFSVIKQGYSNRGFDSYIERNLGEFKLLLYSKKIVNQSNFRENENIGIYVTGTLIYKGLNYSYSLDKLFLDLQNKTFESDKLLGHYSILFYNGKNLSLINDPFNIYSIYYSENKYIISSSFLALSKLVKIDIDSFAAQEILLTGMNHGERTLIKTIKRLSFSKNTQFPSIELIKPNIHYNEKTYKNKFEAVEDQITVLNNYFSDIKNIANDSGVDSGLTGGFDSRLIFLLGKKHFNNIQVHSHWRKNSGKELLIAGLLAESSGYELISIPIVPPIEMNEEQLIETLRESMYFYDGHLRAYAYWYEEYNTEKYRKKILGNKKLGLNGIGGEQYRNQERMCLPFWNYKHWIKKEVLKNSFTPVFIDSNSEKVFIDELSKRIAFQLGYNKPPKFITHKEIKKYYAEIYVPGLRGIRASCENQFTFFLSPFAEPVVAKSAYNIIPFLGCTLNFESKMISKLSSTIAAIDSDHGFSFIKGEPFFKGLLASVIVNLFPYSIRAKFIYKKRGQDRVRNFEKLVGNHKIIREYIGEVEALNLPINISAIRQKPDLNHLLISMGYFITKLKQGDI